MTWIRGNSVEFIGVAVVGAKNEALFPGRVPHVRPSVHPDFLSSFLALTNFMRLSLMKAAHASVGGRPLQEIRDHGPKKTGRSPSQRFCWAKRLRPRARVLAHRVKALEKSVFGPCTLGRTWGTRPEPMTVVGRSNPGEFADLIWTSLKFSRPYGARFRDALSHADAKTGPGH